jgi:hypothetical protein
MCHQQILTILESLQIRVDSQICVICLRPNPSKTASATKHWSIFSKLYVFGLYINSLGHFNFKVHTCDLAVVLTCWAGPVVPMTFPNEKFHKQLKWSPMEPTGVGLTPTGVQRNETESQVSFDLAP